MMDVRFNPGPLHRLARSLPGLSKVVRTSAFRIQRHAQMRAPVKTGALRASLYTVTNEAHGYGEAVGNAEAKAAGKGKRVDPAPPMKDARDSMEAHVASGVNYAVKVEEGDGNRPPKPFLGPAANEERPRFERAVREEIRKNAMAGGFR